MSTATVSRQNTQQAAPNPQGPSPTDTGFLEKIIERTERLDAVVTKARQQIEAAKGQITRSVYMAAAIEELEKSIDAETLRLIKRLANTKLGFLTDRDPNKLDRNGQKPSPYPDHVIKQCFIEASLRGVNLEGNHFNIISGSVYITREGCEHLVKTIPGLTDLDPTNTLPMYKEGRAQIEVSADWKYHGKPMSLKKTVSCRVNNGSTDDTVIGKAMRKLMHAIHKRMTGSVISTDDDEDVEDVHDTAPQKPEAHDHAPAPEESTQEPTQPTDAEAPQQLTEQPNDDGKISLNAIDAIELLRDEAGLADIAWGSFLNHWSLAALEDATVAQGDEIARTLKARIESNGMFGDQRQRQSA